jgi:hypothetical protein
MRYGTTLKYRKRMSQEEEFAAFLFVQTGPAPEQRPRNMWQGPEWRHVRVSRDCDSDRETREVRSWTSRRRPPGQPGRAAGPGGAATGPGGAAAGPAGPAGGRTPSDWPRAA